MSAVNTITIPEVTQLAEIIWLQKERAFQLDPMNMLNSGIYKKENFPDGTGDSRQYSHMDMNEYARTKTEGANAKQSQVYIGNKKMLYITRVAEDLPITWEFRHQGKYMEINQTLGRLSDLVWNRLDLDLAHRFTFCTAISYTNLDGGTVDTTVSDGLALASTVHTLTGSATTFRNRVAGNPAPSMGSIEALESLFVNETYSEGGAKRTMTPDVLLTSDDPNTCNVVTMVLKSTGNPEGAHSGVANPTMMKYRHVKSARLATTAVGAPDSTKAKYHFLISTSNSSAICAIQEYPRMKPPTDEKDSSADDVIYGARGAWGIAIVHPSFVKFSSGDGEA